MKSGVEDDVVRNLHIVSTGNSSSSTNCHRSNVDKYSCCIVKRFLLDNQRCNIERQK